MKKTKTNKKPVKAVKVLKSSAKGAVAIIPNAKMFMDVLKIYSEQITESQVINEKGNMTFLAMDPANVSLLTLNFKKAFFRKNTLKGRDFLNVSDKEEVGLLRLSKEIKEGDILTIEQHKEYYNLILKPTSGSEKKIKVPLIDKTDIRELKKPKLDRLKVNIKIAPPLFAEIIQNAKNVLESILFRVTKDKKLSFTCEGDLSTYHEDADADINLINWDTESSIESKYSVEYLSKISQKSSRVFKSGTLEMSFATDYPLILTYREANIELEMILAPRVDND